MSQFDGRYPHHVQVFFALLAYDVTSVAIMLESHVTLHLTPREKVKTLYLHPTLPLLISITEASHLTLANYFANTVIISLPPPFPTSPYPYTSIHSALLVDSPTLEYIHNITTPADLTPLPRLILSTDIGLIITTVPPVASTTCLDPSTTGLDPSTTTHIPLSTLRTTTAPPIALLASTLVAIGCPTDATIKFIDLTASLLVQTLNAPSKASKTTHPVLLNKAGPTHTLLPICHGSPNSTTSQPSSSPGHYSTQTLSLLSSHTSDHVFLYTLQVVGNIVTESRPHAMIEGVKPNVEVREEKDD